MKTLRLITFLFLLTNVGFAQNKDGSLVKWMTITEAVNASKTTPKPIILDFYTDWCGWCKRMMATTYADPGLASYINQYFYPVKFDAEGKDTVTFQGKTYMPTSMAPKTSHPLAIELLGGKMMYPSTLFLNGYDNTKDEFQVKMLAPGYLEKQKIEPILVFTLENVFRTTALETFSQNFETAFYDSTLQKRMDAVKWKQPQEVFDGNFAEQKKKLVFMHTDWCNSCRVMERAVFSDSSLKVIREKFVMVDFNPENQKPLFWNNKLYQKLPEDKFPFHPLTLEFTRGNFILPSIAILDEQGTMIDHIPFYIAPEMLGQIMTFYGEDIYKKKSWADWQKEREEKKK
jgi:thioredoxin-related protein